jgi:acyl-CoA thioesterase
MSMPDVPAPETVPTTEADGTPGSGPSRSLEMISRERPIETRSVTDHNPFSRARASRGSPDPADGELPDIRSSIGIVVRVDLMLLDGDAARRDPWNDQSYVMASSITRWFHRPPRDRVLAESLAARGFARPLLHERRTIVASVAQRAHPAHGQGRPRSTACGLGHDDTNDAALRPRYD